MTNFSGLLVWADLDFAYKPKSVGVVNCQGYRMSSWIARLYVKLLELFYPGITPFFGFRLRHKFDEMTVTQKDMLRRAVRNLSRGYAILSILQIVFILIALPILSFIIMQKFGSDSLQRFGTVWIAVSIIVIFYDLSPLSFFSIKDIEDTNIIPVEFETEARGIHDAYKPYYNFFRRTVEVLTLIVGTLITGYGDIVADFILPIVG